MSSGGATIAIARGKPGCSWNGARDWVMDTASRWLASALTVSFWAYGAEKVVPRFAGCSELVSLHLVVPAQ